MAPERFQKIGSSRNSFVTFGMILGAYLVNMRIFQHRWGPTQWLLHQVD